LSFSSFPTQLFPPFDPFGPHRLPPNVLSRCRVIPKQAQHLRDCRDVTQREPHSSAGGRGSAVRAAQAEEARVAPAHTGIGLVAEGPGQGNGGNNGGGCLPVYSNCSFDDSLGTASFVTSASVETLLLCRSSTTSACLRPSSQLPSSFLLPHHIPFRPSRFRFPAYCPPHELSPDRLTATPSRSFLVCSWLCPSVFPSSNSISISPFLPSSSSSDRKHTTFSRPPSALRILFSLSPNPHSQRLSPYFLLQTVLDGQQREMPRDVSTTPRSSLHPSDSSTSVRQLSRPASSDSLRETVRVDRWRASLCRRRASWGCA
jgi:hypothetical protein